MMSTARSKHHRIEIETKTKNKIAKDGSLRGNWLNKILCFSDLQLAFWHVKQLAAPIPPSLPSFS